MSATTVRLLQAAAAIAGGTAALADLLGIDEVLIDACTADRRELPDSLLLRTVDIVLADRRRKHSGSNETSLATAAQAADMSSGRPSQTLVPGAKES